MRIVHGGLPYLPIPHTKGGANEKIIYQLARAQAYKHNVHILSVGQQLTNGFKDGIQIHYLPCKTGPGGEYGFYIRMALMVQQLGADVFHLHASSLSALILSFLTRHSIPTVVSINYPYIRPNLGLGRIGLPIDELIARLSLRKVDRFVFISDYSYRLFRSRYGNFDSRHVIIPSGVNTEYFRPDMELRAQTRLRYGLDGRKVILFVGRICKQKGVHILFDAMTQLIADDPTYTLVMVGPAAKTFHDSTGTNFANYVIQRVKAIDGQYLGELEEDELIAIMNASDILVLPTLQLEMFGMVLIEAMACGKAVVASNHGGIPEVIRGSTAGRLFPLGDSLALASIISKIFATDLLDSSVPRAHAQIFDWKEIAAKYQIEYERVREHITAYGR